jgi:hypothetical protein
LKLAYKGASRLFFVSDKTPVDLRSRPQPRSLTPGAHLIVYVAGSDDTSGFSYAVQRIKRRRERDRCRRSWTESQRLNVTGGPTTAS